MTWIYENVTERLDLESRYNSLIHVQGETLDHLSEGVGVFGSDGMPHGVREGLRQSLFPDPRYPGQALTLEEFVAGYCMPDDRAGHIEVQVDPDRRRVTARVALARP